MFTSTKLPANIHIVPTMAELKKQLEKSGIQDQGKSVSPSSTSWIVSGFEVEGLQSAQPTTSCSLVLIFPHRIKVRHANGTTETDSAATKARRENLTRQLEKFEQASDTFLRPTVEVEESEDEDAAGSSGEFTELHLVSL